MAAVRTFVARVLLAALTVWALASGVFFATRLLPGDPAALVLGDLAGAEERAELRARLHLDEPLAFQYLRFARSVVSLDLGPSLARPGTTAFSRVREALPPTARLAGLSVLLGTLAGLGAAVMSVGPWLGRARRWVDCGVIAIAATPLLAFAPLATWLLSVRTRIIPLPGDPAAGFAGLLFAAALLGVPLGAQIARVGRAALLDLGRAPFLDVARAKGATAVRTWLIHGLPAASAPIVAVVATQLGALLGGAVVLERLFERPGLGTLMLEAYSTRDLPVLEGSILASGALFVGAQAIAAGLHAFIDPRIRSGG